VNVRARVLELTGIARVRLEGGERFEAPLERLIDLALDPGERAKIEFGCGFSGHDASSSLSPKPIPVLQQEPRPMRRSDTERLPGGARFRA